MIINGITYNETIKRINGDNSLLQMRILINEVYYGFAFYDGIINFSKFTINEAENTFEVLFNEYYDYCNVLNCNEMKAVVNINAPDDVIEINETFIIEDIRIEPEPQPIN